VPVVPHQTVLLVSVSQNMSQASMRGTWGGWVGKGGKGGRVGGKGRRMMNARVSGVAGWVGEGEGVTWTGE
jgi:hypothetical protein